MEKRKGSAKGQHYKDGMSAILARPGYRKMKHGLIAWGIVMISILMCYTLGVFGDSLEAVLAVKIVAGIMALGFIAGYMGMVYRANKTMWSEWNAGKREIKNKE